MRNGGVKMSQTTLWQDLMANWTNLGREWNLLKRSLGRDHAALSFAQLKATVQAAVAIMLPAMLFYLGIVGVTLSTDSTSFSLYGSPIFMLAQLSILVIHKRLKNYNPALDEDSERITLARRRFGVCVALIAACYAGLVMDLWSMLGAVDHVIAGATAFGLMGLGTLTYSNLPLAMMKWLLILTVAALAGPALAGEVMPWYFYAAAVIYGTSLHRIAMMQWRSFIELIEDAQSFAQHRADFYDAEQGRLEALEDERRKASAGRAEERRLAESERFAAMEALAKDFEKSVHATADAVGTAVVAVGESAQQLATIGAQTLQRSDAMTSMATGMREAIQAVAAAAQQLRDSSDAISAQVNEQVAASDAASEMSRDGSASIASLASDAEQINAIAAIIQDVAGKTNLLALNATIEAARAGEAGRGFAVVAQEVKSLAIQAQGAIGSVTETVATIRTRMDGASDTVGSVVDKMGQVQEGAYNIAAAIAQQQMATQEITTNANNAAHDAHKVSTYSDEVNSVAKSVGELADEMHQVMLGLETQAQSLRESSSAFLSRLRAA
jgi:methyl-accepting chemotaxis protein